MQGSWHQCGQSKQKQYRLLSVIPSTTAIVQEEANQNTGDGGKH